MSVSHNGTLGLLLYLGLRVELLVTAGVQSGVSPVNKEEITLLAVHHVSVF